MVLALRVVCGLSMTQTAMHLGIQETAAAARLTRAKRALAMARGEFRIPDGRERRARLPVVLDCVAGVFTVAHRCRLSPSDALTDVGRQALGIADALVASFPDDPDVRGLRAVIRLGLARRRGRVDATGVPLTLDEVDRTAWDQRLLRAGLADAVRAVEGDGRFSLEAAIAGLHSVAPSFAETEWSRIVPLYRALEQVWPSPAVLVARLVAEAQAILAAGGRPAPGDPASGDPAPVDLPLIETGLQRLAAEGPSYARRDALFALADLCWHTGRRDEASARYRQLAALTEDDAVRRFCERRCRGN